MWSDVKCPVLRDNASFPRNQDLQNTDRMPQSCVHRASSTVLAKETTVKSCVLHFNFPSEALCDDIVLG